MVLDEADRMIDEGFEEPVNQILSAMGSELKAEEEEELRRQKRYEQVRARGVCDDQTQRMIVEENLREIEERENQGKKKDPHTLEVIPDDTDDLTNEAEIQAWKQREFERIMRERVKEEERLRVAGLGGRDV